MVSRPTRPARGEIWLVDFQPTRGSEHSSIRPALVLSSDRYHQAQSRLAIVLPVTSRIKSYPFHLTVQPEESGLDKPSAIMIDQVRVVATERFIHDHALGRLAQAAMTRVEDLFRVLFELP